MWHNYIDRIRLGRICTSVQVRILLCNEIRTGWLWLRFVCAMLCSFVCALLILPRKDCCSSAKLGYLGFQPGLSYSFIKLFYDFIKVGVLWCFFSLVLILCCLIRYIMQLSYVLTFISICSFVIRFWLLSELVFASYTWFWFSMAPNLLDMEDFSFLQAFRSTCWYVASEGVSCIFSFTF